MRKLFPRLLIISFATGCVQTTETASDNSKPVRKLAWYDSLILEYIANNDTGALQQVQIDNAGEIEWKFDGMIETDSINFMAFRVGHTAEGRFMTDDWVYIDSNKRRLYGYDTGTDSISLWQKK
ncbi:hypothetical protein [Polluticoccus soli]|uniref:hypothetical protein n=1 Tax=Polluticoccus soli TaxID=3034150 RepID=UPI0023E0BC9B|nr:hypothetical protein [Flavipsychrobacter sp. JY13-12]